ATAVLQRALRRDRPTGAPGPAGAPGGGGSAALPDALRGFLDRVRADPALRGRASRPAAPNSEVVPAGGRFLSASYGNAAGRRDYKLYVPSGYRGAAVPLVVMLHGCTQSPDDFAAGTRMNLLAE